MSTHVETVQQLYVAYFNRPADVAGLNFWTSALANGVSSSVIASEFSKQAEYKALFEGKSVDTIIDTVYINMFGRHAEQAALDFYGPLVQNGTITIAKVVTDIVAGAQGTDGDAYNNKVSAATTFTETLAAPGNEADRVAYSSGDTKVLNVAKAWLATITDEASLATAIAGVENTVDQLVAVITPSQTLYLTQGLDTLAGGVGNDKFFALAFNSVSGADTTTLNSVDSIDGSAGEDSLFIEVKDAGATNYNGTITGTITNIEHITIDNTAADVAVLGGTTLNAAKFVGATDITQVTNAADVVGLGANTVAGFKDVDANVAVTAAAGTAKINLDGYGEGNTITVDGTSVAGVVLTGSVNDTNADDTVDAPTVDLTVGKDKQTATFTTEVDSILTVAETGGSTKHLLTVDASGSTGGVEFDGTGLTTVLTIKGGAGDDTLVINSTTAAAAGSTPASDATIDGGAGDDDIDVATTGTGATTVTGGDGDDTVNITSRGTGVLTVNLGAGDDVFTSGVAVNATDVIDAGAGSDKLLLNLVGAANVGAFANFDSFDAINLAKTLDVDILATKNTVTEFVTTGGVGAGAVLTNVGAGVGYRVLADTNVAQGLTLTQKTAGDITLTMDIDETTDATTVSTNHDAAVTTNATGVKVVFDADFAGKAASATDNVAAMTVTATAAKTFTVESGGDLAANVLTIGAGAAALTTVTVTGAANTTLNFGGAAAKLATIDASAATGGLVTSLANVIDGGTIKLGSGTDLITATVASTTAGIESIVGFEKAAAAAVGTDAAAKAAAILETDILAFSGAVADAAGGVFTNGTIAKGVLTFTGAGPATLDAAIAIANVAAETAGETVVFEYLGNSYVFNQVDGNAASVDIVVKLTGVTGITNLVEDTTTVDHFFIV